MTIKQRAEKEASRLYEKYTSPGCDHPEGITPIIDSLISFHEEESANKRGAQQQRIELQQDQIKELETEIQELRRWKHPLENTADSIRQNQKVEIESLKVQNQELVEALEGIARDKEFSHKVDGSFCRKVWYVESAKQALAKYKGENND